MNRIKYIFALLLAGLAITSCHDWFDETVSDDDMLIQLKSRIPTSPVMAKSEGWNYDSQIDGGLNLTMYRWDEGGSTNIASLSSLNGVLGGTPDPADGWKRSIHINPAQYYKDRTSQVGFIGFYPRLDDQGWKKTGSSYYTTDAQGRPTLTFDIDGNTDVMFSDFQKGGYETGVNSLTLSHALCKYDIYVYAADKDTKDQWGTIEEIILMNLPEQLFVHLPKNITDASQSIEYTYTPAPSDDVYTPTRIPADTELPVSLANKKYIGSYLGGAPAIGVLGVGVSATNAESRSPVSIARNFRPGYAYSIILRFSSHGVINADVIAEDWNKGVDLDTETDNMFYVDLSKYGTANSYVVSSANMAYSFNASVKGNGVNVLTRYDGTTFTLPDVNTNLPVASVKILSSDTKLKWDAEKQDYVPPANDDDRHAPIIRLFDEVVNGLVLFEVIGAKNPDGTMKEDDYQLQRKGNVRLGAYDVMGKLIWSWHIWVTDRPLNLNYGNGYTSMDRNLGAVSTDPDDYSNDIPVLSGAVYQWGRKDPIFTHEIKTHPELYIQNGPVLSILEAHQNPRTFYKQSSSDYNDWLKESDDHLWGWISERDDMVKTMYDPCPPGYRVNGNPLWEYQSTNQKSPVEIYRKVDGKNTNVGYEFGIIDYSTIYYAATTFIEHNGEIIRNHDLKEADNGKAYIYRYSATPYVSGDSDKQGLAYHFRYNIDDVSSYGKTLFYEPDMGGGRVHGFPVRCVYEDSKRPIVDLSREQTSNCYVVESAGYFKFDATAPGNSVGALNVQFYDGSMKNITFDGGVAEKLTSVEKVDVLWWQGDLTAGSSYQSFASQSSLQEDMENACPVQVLDDGALDKNGDAYFFIPRDRFQSANVILAGYDANGIIQWTWHLWLVPERLKVVRLGDYNVLDRNLGATFAPANVGDVNEDNALSTHGFYYQWGRKDPFVGMESYNQGVNSTATSVWFHKSYEGQWTKKNSLDKFGSSKTIEETIKSPTYLANPGSNKSQWQTNYGTESGNDLPINQFWGYTGVEGAWGDTFAKTMWDPCPSGYKVANHIVFNSGGLWNPNTGAVETYRFGNMNSGYSTKFGIWLDEDGMYVTGIENGNDIRADGIWIPYTKMINSSGSYAHSTTGNGISNSGAWHSACPYSGNRSRTLAYYNNNGTLYTAHKNDTYISAGAPIRCIKE